MKHDFTCDKNYEQIWCYYYLRYACSILILTNISSMFLIILSPFLARILIKNISMMSIIILIIITLIVVIVVMIISTSSLISANYS